MTPTYYKYKQLRDIGMTRREIADFCGVSKNVVSVTLWRHATPERHERYRARERTGPVMMPRSWKPKPDDVLRNILRLRSERKTYAEIAGQLGLSRNSVAGLVYRHGLNP